VRAQLSLLKLRARHPAFAGRFAFEVSGDRIELRWSRGGTELYLEADFGRATFSIGGTFGDRTQSLSNELLLADGGEALLGLLLRDEPAPGLRGRVPNG